MQNTKILKIIIAITMGQLEWILMFSGFATLMESSIILVPVIIGVSSALFCGWWSLLSGATLPLFFIYKIIESGPPTGEGGMFVVILIISSGIMMISSTVCCIIKNGVANEHKSKKAKN